VVAVVPQAAWAGCTKEPKKGAPRGALFFCGLRINYCGLRI
jgi:hypothetical protein